MKSIANTQEYYITIHCFKSINNVSLGSDRQWCNPPINIDTFISSKKLNQNN